VLSDPQFQHYHGRFAPPTEDIEPQLYQNCLGDVSVEFEPDTTDLDTVGYYEDMSIDDDLEDIPLNDEPIEPTTPPAATEPSPSPSPRIE